MEGELPTAVACTLTETAMNDERHAYPQPGRSLFEQRVLLALPVPGWFGAVLARRSALWLLRR